METVEKGITGSGAACFLAMKLVVKKENKLNITKLLAEQIDKNTMSLIKHAGEVAQAMGLSAYLVGGMVRDVVMGLEPSRDIDITVEGDGLAFGRSLADEFGAAYKGFDKFRTARIFLKTGMRIDVATARNEEYPEPGMLPIVELAAINQDLYRRDFTINAMAVCINKDRFGELLDPFGGTGDLKAGTLKVLHDKSFIDDPTRILRFIRFKARFGFGPDKNTLKLFREAITAGVFDTVSCERLREELMLVLKEEKFYQALRELSANGALSALAPGIRLSPGIRTVFARIKAGANTVTDVSLLKVFALLNYSGDKDVKRFIERFKFSNTWKDTITQGRRVLKLKNRLAVKGLLKSKIYMLLKGFDTCALECLRMVSESKALKKNTDIYLKDIIKTKISVTGNDLKRLGVKEGPGYGKILDRVMTAKLDGKAKTKEDELKIVKKIIQDKSLRKSL